jgi:hypothetical protein
VKGERLTHCVCFEEGGKVSGGYLQYSVAHINLFGFEHSVLVDHRRRQLFINNAQYSVLLLLFSIFTYIEAVTRFLFIFHDYA